MGIRTRGDPIGEELQYQKNEGKSGDIRLGSF